MKKTQNRFKNCFKTRGLEAFRKVILEAILKFTVKAFEKYCYEINTYLKTNLPAITCFLLGKNLRDHALTTSNKLEF